MADIGPAFEAVARRREAKEAREASPTTGSRGYFLTTSSQRYTSKPLLKPRLNPPRQFRESRAASTPLTIQRLSYLSGRRHQTLYDKFSRNGHGREGGPGAAVPAPPVPLRDLTPWLGW
jgi:hypothetical protein